MTSLINGLFSALAQPSDPSDSQPGLCSNCKSQPQARDSTTGGYYLFCSNACAAPLVLPGLPTGPSTVGGPNIISASSSKMCNYCKKRQKYIDGAIVHPYCGLTCANLARGRKKSTNGNVLASNRSVINPSSTANSTTKTIGPSVRLTGSSDQLCQAPGCSSPVYVNLNGVADKYCAKPHGRSERHGCISCRKAPTNGSVVFCDTCNDEVLRTAPMIVKVPEDHDRYRSVASQFRKKWLHNQKCPKVREIYKIVSTTESIEKYQQYLNKVEARGNFVSRKKTRGNENRRWHGTMRTCNIGDEGVTKFCLNRSCSLCSIMKTSFDRSFSVGHGMFGTGIYTSATSSKSDTFSSNICTSKWKAMLLNKVVVGRGHRMTTSNTTLSGPPPGYDSILAEAGAGLNFDEVVVYNNDAIRPSYLVMYDIPK